MAPSALGALGEVMGPLRTQHALYARLAAVGLPDPGAQPPLLPGPNAAWCRARALAWASVRPEVRFVDLAAPATHDWLTLHGAPVLAERGLREADRGVVMSPDRRLTRPLALLLREWARDRREPPVAGIRYESRLVEGLECHVLFGAWALERDSIQITPLRPDDERVRLAARLLGLGVFDAPA